VEANTKVNQKFPENPFAINKSKALSQIRLTMD